MTEIVEVLCADGLGALITFDFLTIFSTPISEVQIFFYFSLCFKKLTLLERTIVFEIILINSKRSKSFAQFGTTSKSKESSRESINWDLCSFDN